MTASIRKPIALLAACAFLPVAAACGGGDDAASPEDVPADAIALVGDQPVPRAEFTSVMERAEQGYEAQEREFPNVGSPEYQDLKSRAIQFLVQRYEYRVEAAELGIEVSDAEIDERLDEIKEQSFEGDDARFEEELENLGLTEAEAREEIRDRLIQEKIYEEVTGDIEVTDEQIRTYYESNEEQFTQPREIRHILVERKRLADRLYAELEDGASFGALAREHSTDRGTARQGGKLTVTRGQTVPEFDAVAFELAEGELSPPVETQFGWHIILATGPVETTPLEESEDTIRQQLLDQRKKEAMDNWVAETRSKYEEQIVYAVGFRPTTTTEEQPESP